MPFSGELDGIVDEVRNHLCEPKTIYVNDKSDSMEFF